MTYNHEEDFRIAMNCTYDEREYSVRDNGAVFRHSRAGKRPYLGDEKWTFGKPNKQNGYMYFGSVRVHRIVATAFHGVPSTSEYVVDHIDTNRRNNRPENLRWVTRLENALLNPITRKRIEFVCGSVEAFLEDPTRLRNSKHDPNFEWMRSVNRQEAQASLERIHLWSKKDKPICYKGSLGEWIYKPATSRKLPTVLPRRTSDLVIAKTLGAAQRKWHIPSKFPCCPQVGKENPILVYAENLIVGAVFSSNYLSTSIVLESAVACDHQSIWVICQRLEEGAVKPWTVAKVTYEDDLYIHANIGTFFTIEGAKKAFFVAQGLEWTGGQTFDDFCC